MKKIRLLAVIFISLVADHAYASDRNGHALVLGEGAQSCGTFLSAYQNNQYGEVSFESYMVGYLTAYNELHKDTYSILGTSDSTGAFQWIIQYCQQHPIENFYNALSALTSELYPNRMRASQ